MTVTDVPPGVVAPATGGRRPASLVEDFAAALVRLLADADGLRPAGEVTDRLGRPGQAYVYDDGSGVRHMLILDPSTGAVLGLEQTFTTDQPEYGVRAGDVMQYRAWMR